MKLLGLGIACAVTALSCGSVNQQASRRAQTTAPFTPDVSINEVMVAQIDHAAHFIWDAANPDNITSDINWLEVEHHSIQLLSSRSAMTMGGAGVNDAMWVVQRSWRGFVDQMNTASMQAMAAAKAKNLTELGLAGDRLVESCEGCHRQYKPSVPTEGLMHLH
jgi:cytochrome c556